VISNKNTGVSYADDAINFPTKAGTETFLLISQIVTCLFIVNYCKGKKGKSIPVKGRGGPKGCEPSRFSHYIDNRLTDCGEVVSLMRRPPFTPRNSPGAHFG
jgi:hypothetical protein